ncbi:MAG: threonine ammonia-lyase [Frankiaceae bacterium]
MRLVDLDDIRAASRSLTGVVRLTPLVSSVALGSAAGGPVLLKCENLQRTGSFKIRGAYVRLARMAKRERGRGVVAASAGNHAQGVALAATLLGARAVVFMPVGTPIPKVEATRGYGAEVRFSGTTLDEALDAAREYAARSDAVLVHPFDHPDVIAGQGTTGLELTVQCPDMRTVLVPTGGGGLVSGVAVAVKALCPAARVVGVQAEGAAAWPASLQVGRPQRLDRMATLADGIAVGCPGEVTFAHVSARVDDIVTVSDEAISRALLVCLERAKLLVEPAGAAAAAAVLDAAPGHFEPPVVVLLSGGNIDPLLLLRVLRHGLVAAGRFLVLRVLVPDRPGSLVALLDVLARTGANVADVEHLRTEAHLHLDEVEVTVQVETRGSEHAAQVLAMLQRSGYQPEQVGAQR